MKICIEKNIKRGGPYFEFLPGEYKQTHWNDISIFVEEEVFELIEPVFRKHLRDSFNPFGPTRVSKLKSDDLINELKNFGTILRNSKSLAEIKEKVDFPIPTSEMFELNVEQQKEDLASLIDELVEWLNSTFRSHELITILGI